MLVHTRCKCPVSDKEEVAISKGYSYYCPNCDEGLYAFETSVAVATATGIELLFTRSSEVTV